MTVCTLPNCGREYYGSGLCRAHYKRMRRSGDPAGSRIMNGEALAWLRAHVAHRGGDCLTWPFAVMSNGYGQVYFEGRHQAANRVMCLLSKGNPVAPRMEAAHNCGNRLCVNPQHLRWATTAENAADRLLHGTHNRGERCGSARLNRAEVKEIRVLAGRLTQLEIADMYGVSTGAIWAVIHRKSWAWLE
jgi:hypothetical protein